MKIAKIEDAGQKEMIIKSSSLSVLLSKINRDSLKEAIQKIIVISASKLM